MRWRWRPMVNPGVLIRPTVESQGNMRRMAELELIPHKVIRPAATELGVTIEWYIHPETHHSREYWGLV